jgi:flagellar motility protein MotE (MotC chaperone)
MKPKDAARILERLELPILLDVLERMREAKVAPILADMDPAKAKTVTAALAERRNLPRPQADAGAEPSSLRPN